MYHFVIVETFSLNKIHFGRSHAVVSTEKLLTFQTVAARLKRFFRRANEPSLHINNRATTTGSHVVTKFTTTGAVWCPAYAFTALDKQARHSSSQAHSSSWMCFQVPSRAARIHIHGIYVYSGILCNSAQRIFLPPRRCLAERIGKIGQSEETLCAEKRWKKNWLSSRKPTTTIRQTNEASVRH